LSSPGVRFTGPGVKYAAGSLDLRTQDKLPADATTRVQQLLLWMPLDPALTWYLAELYNAQGDVPEALRLFDSLSSVGGETREHRRVLLEAADRFAQKKPEVEAPGPAPEAPKEEDTKSSDLLPEWLPDWRPLAVGLGAGFVLGVLVVLQLRQIFRRRPARA
jgi:hypothetical protein